MAAVGYCFGGATVMQLAYSGADLSGVVSFHGSLPIPSKEQALNTKASILIEHGYEDKFVSTDHIAKFMAAVSETGIDWQMTYHSDARHGFTNPDANSFGIEGLQYNERADRRSWENMQVFFREIFGVTDAPGIALKQ
jgi:dienelactone hydrolase